MSGGRGERRERREERRRRGEMSRGGARIVDRIEAAWWA
jgi:hypothetical protein